MPDFLILLTDLIGTLERLAAILASAPALFVQAGRLVEIVGDGVHIETRTVRPATLEAHALRICRPVKPMLGFPGAVTPAYLGRTLVEQLLHQPQLWAFRELRGVTWAAPLSDDGTWRTEAGYDPASKMWVIGSELPIMPETVTQEAAAAALLEIRRTFASFPFADRTVAVDATGESVVDLTQPPGRDESAFIVGLMTAVCRPSLPLAPALLLRAPSVSGAGTGKGLLARAVMHIAYGIEAPALTTNGDRREIEKGIAATMSASAPALYLDNLNDVDLQSNLLAQILTEPACQVRLLGESRMRRLPSNLFVVATGNGTTLAEDMLRRVITVELDARCEAPEGRAFAVADFSALIRERRTSLLQAALVIWSWGRRTTLPKGRPLGSYEQWSVWVRDPLLALGCLDPVEAMAERRALDPVRDAAAVFFSTWHDRHGAIPIKVSELSAEVLNAAPVVRKSRQSVTTCVNRLIGSHIHGYRLDRIEHPGTGAAKYVVSRVAGTG